MCRERECLVILCRRVWLRQSRLLALLCCGLLGSAALPDQDMLLELAAARVLTLLLDPSSWAYCASGTLRTSLPSPVKRRCKEMAYSMSAHEPNGRCGCAGTEKAQEAASELRAYLGSMPALARAVKRLIAREHDSSRTQASDSDASAAAKSSGDVQQSMVSKQRDMAVKLAMQALLSTLWPCAASSAIAADGGAQRPDQASEPGWQSAAAGHFAKITISSPQRLSGMPSQVRAQLTSLKALEAIIPALDAVAEQQSPAEQERPGQRDTALRTECRASCQRC